MSETKNAPFFLKRFQAPSDLERVAVTAFLLRGLWMLWPRWHSIPLEVQGYLIPSWFTEVQWGLVLVTIALAQLTLAFLRRGHVCRALVATFGAVVQGMACIGYYNGGVANRAVVPLIITVVLVEMVIALRAWRDFVAARSRDLPDRRAH
jgi:hypothetical protein